MFYEKHEKFMNEALKQAKKAYESGEVPVGCIIVKDDEIIAEASNMCEQNSNPLLHAECLAIAQACAKTRQKRLNDCVLYVTLEPCSMCAGAIINAEIAAVYFGARDDILGACGGAFNLFEENLGHHPILIGGILQDESKQMLGKFFQDLRKNK